MNDNVLISKVEHYGVRGTVLSWFENYLANRQQYVKFNDLHSKSYQIKCGVPQGSILAPLLYACNVSKVVDFILFHGDTNIFFPKKISIYFLTP